MYAFLIYQRPVKKESARLRDTIRECKQQDPRSVYTLRRDADLCISQLMLKDGLLPRPRGQ